MRHPAGPICLIDPTGVRRAHVATWRASVSQPVDASLAVEALVSATFGSAFELEPLAEAPLSASALWLEPAPSDFAELPARESFR